MVYPSTSPSAGQIIYDIASELSKQFTQQLPDSTFWFVLSSSEIYEWDVTATPVGKDFAAARKQLVQERWEIATGGNRNPDSPTPQEWEQSLWGKARQGADFQAALFDLELQTALTPEQRHLPLHVLSQKQDDMILDLRFNHKVKVVGVDPQPDPAIREELDRALRSLTAHEVVELSHKALEFLSARVEELDTHEPAVEQHSADQTRGIKAAIAGGLRSSTMLSRINRDDIISRADKRQTGVIQEFRAEMREAADDILRSGLEAAREVVGATSALSQQQVHQLRSLIQATQNQVHSLVEVGIADGSLMGQGAARTVFESHAKTDSAVEDLRTLNHALGMRRDRAKHYAEISFGTDAGDLDKYEIAIADAHRAEVAADFIKAYESVASWIAPREPTFDTSRSL